MWNELEEELKTNNRDFHKSEFITIFDKCAKEAKCIIPKGYILYRARKIETDELPFEVKQIINTANENLKDFDHPYQPNKDEDIWDYIKNIPFENWEQYYKDDLKTQNISFWGFNGEKSDAPRYNNVQGRANPVGISYLYTARDINTAISEIQPTIGQLISVAKIKTTKKLNIFTFDFYSAFKNSELMNQHIGEIKKHLDLSNFWQLGIFFCFFLELFSNPALGRTNNYYSTQYLSEYIKNLGFDGIKYKSSLKNGGSNIVLFDTSKDENGNHKNYEILNSTLHKVNNVKITSSLILPKKS
jgi:uncharacterized protein YrzB (UPF0473 family)